MLLLWLAFLLIVLALLALDLGVINRRAHVIGMREAVAWSVFWMSLALAFNGLVYVVYEHHLLGAGLSSGPGGRVVGGSEAALDFFTAWLIEKSLSVDNIFVMAMIFGYFRVPAAYQHRVLFWGILGALVMRGAMILVGVWLVRQFDWLFYVFGAFLLYTALKLLRPQAAEVDPERSLVVRLARRLLPISPSHDGARFTTRVDGRRVFTPLVVVLVIIEASDVVFAIDSVPAVFAITTDPFIVMTSNVFAILGLRALYFVLAGMLGRFRYLGVSLAVILSLVGFKMLVHEVVAISSGLSLALIATALVAGVVASLVAERREAGAAK